MSNARGTGSSPMTAVNYVVSFAVFGMLYFVAPQVTQYFVVSPGSAFWDWLFFVSIVAAAWSLWIAMVRQRCKQSLGIWRLLKANLASLSVFFLISAGLFVASVITLELKIPPESNLMNTRNASLILVYCRLPILSHPVALYVLVTSLVYSIVCGPLDYRKGILFGGLAVVLYYFVMYACGSVFAELVHRLLVSPEETHLLIMFLYWIPTVLFALMAYTAYAFAFREK